MIWANKEITPRQDHDGGASRRNSAIGVRTYTSSGGPRLTFPEPRLLGRVTVHTGQNTQHHLVGAGTDGVKASVAVET